MKKVCTLVSVLLIAFISFGCGPKLSEDEAKKLIVDKFKYPQSQFTRHNIYPEKGGQNWEMICKLINEGYVSNSGKRDMFYDNIFVIHEKSKQFIRKFSFNGYHAPRGEYKIDVLTYNTVIDKIDEILIDKKNNSAVVTYSVNEAVVDPYGSAFLSPSETEDIKKFREQRRIDLKMYDKGWRIEGDEQNTR